MLHDGLRDAAAQPQTRAIAICENVFIGADRTPAIKVLMEHRAGFTAAMYLPFKPRFLRGPSYGEPILQPAEPELGGWTPA